MNISKLSLVLLVLLLVQTVALTTIVMRQPEPATAAPDEQPLEIAQIDAKASAAELSRSIAITKSAAERGSWTREDSTQLRMSIDRMTREDQEVLLNAIGDVVNSQEFPPDAPVILPFADTLPEQRDQE